MMNPTFAQSTERARALIAAGTIHPGGLVDLASVRLRRLAEWADESDYCARLKAEALAVLAEGQALVSAFNAAR